MGKEPIKQNKEGLAINLGGIMSGLMKGIGGLFGLAMRLEKEGKSEYKEVGEIRGKTENGKEYHMAYGFRTKVGIDPAELEKKGI